MSLKVALIFSVFDGDEQHFSRFCDELDRLAFPFYVNFDHCSPATKRLFKSHPRYAGGYDNDDPASHFDEMHRQFALDLVQRDGSFDWFFHMDVDETLERDAPQIIHETLTTTTADIIDCQLLDLWGDEKHYRVDGPFRYSHREKFFNLRTAKSLQYYHPTCHAPKHVPHGNRQAVTSPRQRPYVIHWGIMDMHDARVHTDRWDAIYTRAVGGNPHGFYQYVNDPNAPVVAEVPEGVL